MKIRLAKKIMNQRPPPCGGSDARQHTMYYWHWRWLEWYNTTHPTISYKPCGLVLDHRITIGNPKKGLCPDKWLYTEFFVIKFK